jgi:hypothetical protein
MTTAMTRATMAIVRVSITTPRLKDATTPWLPISRIGGASIHPPPPRLPRKRGLDGNVRARLRSAAADLCPDAISALGDPLDAPAFAERVYEVESKASVGVRGADRDHAVTAAVLHLEVKALVGEAYADDDVLVGAHAAVAHAVRDQLGHEQLGGVELRTRDATVQTAIHE